LAGHRNLEQNHYLRKLSIRQTPPDVFHRHWRSARPVANSVVGDESRNRLAHRALPTHRILHSAPTARTRKRSRDATYVATSGLHMYASHLPGLTALQYAWAAALICTADDSFKLHTVFDAARRERSSIRDPSFTIRSYYHADCCMSLRGTRNFVQQVSFACISRAAAVFSELKSEAGVKEQAHQQCLIVEPPSWITSQGRFDTTIPHVS
jgi:hypothetical protein